MAEGQDDDARVQEIRARVEGLEKLLEDTTGQWDRSQLLHMVSELAGAAKTIPYLLARLDALTAERDAARAWSARWKDCARVLRRAARQQYESWQRACDDISALSADLDRTEAGRDAAVARAERAEAARDHALKVISSTIEAVTPEPCRCVPAEFCAECLPIKTLEAALAAASEGAQEGRDGK